MTLSEDIRKKAGRTGYKSSDWYTNSLMNELQNYQKKNINQLDTFFIEPGDFVFFLYSAKFAQKYKFWDQHPLVYIIDVNPRSGLFFGSNVHYLNPSYRGAVARTYLNKKGEVNAPRKTLKNYLFGNVGKFFDDYGAPIMTTAKALNTGFALGNQLASQKEYRDFQRSYEKNLRNKIFTQPVMK